MKDNWVKRYHVNKIINWGLNLSAILMLLTGFGITRYQLIEPLTFGLLGKALSFRLHIKIAYLFILFFAARLGLNFYYKKKKR